MSRRRFFGGHEVVPVGQSRVHRKLAALRVSRRRFFGGHEVVPVGQSHVHRKIVLSRRTRSRFVGKIVVSRRARSRFTRKTEILGRARGRSFDGHEVVPVGQSRVHRMKVTVAKTRPIAHSASQQLTDLGVNSLEFEGITPFQTHLQLWRNRHK